MAVADADGLAAVAPERGTWAEVVVIDAVIVGRFIDFNLNRDATGGVALEVAVIHAVASAAGEVNPLAAAIGRDDRAIGKAIVAAGELHQTIVGTRVGEVDATDDEMLAGDDQTGLVAVEECLAGRLGAERDGFIRGSLAC